MRTGKSLLAIPVLNSNRGQTGMSVQLIHLEQIDPQKLPATARASEKQNRGPGTLPTQFFGVESDVRGHQICVQLFCAQDARLPELGLRAYDTVDKSNKLARNNARLEFTFLPAYDCLVQLRDESANGAVYLLSIGSCFRLDATGPSCQRRGILGLSAHGIVEALRSLRRLSFPQSDLAESDVGPSQGCGCGKRLLERSPKKFFCFVNSILTKQRAGKHCARFLHVWSSGQNLASDGLGLDVVLPAIKSRRFTQGIL